MLLSGYHFEDKHTADFIMLTLGEGVKEEIRYWLTHIYESTAPITFTSTVVGFSFDASAIGWGGWCGFDEIAGFFSADEECQSSTLREMVALRLVFLHFLGKLAPKPPLASRGGIRHLRVIRANTDNKGVSSIMKWGSRNKSINDIAKELSGYAEAYGFIWHVVWMPRELNTRADIISKSMSVLVVLNPRAMHLFYLNKRLKPDVHVFCNRASCIPQTDGKFWHPSDPHAINKDGKGKIYHVIR